MFQFEFANDYAPFFRPSAAFMTPKQASGKYSNAQTDCAQVFNSIFAVFGNKNPIFDYSKEFKPGKLPNGEQAVSQVAEKMFGICQRFWGSQYPSQANAYYPLQYLQSLLQIIGVAI